MARVFNISFPYGETLYNALVTVNGNDEDRAVYMRVEKDTIHLFLPHGKLSFPVKEVVNYFANLQKQNEPDMSMAVTPNISLHLLNVNW